MGNRAGHHGVIRELTARMKEIKLLAQMIVEFKTAANDISDNSSNHALASFSLPSSIFPVHFPHKRFKHALIFRQHDQYTLFLHFVVNCDLTFSPRFPLPCGIMIACIPLEMKEVEPEYHTDISSST